MKHNLMILTQADGANATAIKGNFFSFLLFLFSASPKRCRRKIRALKRALRRTSSNGNLFAGRVGAGSLKLEPYPLRKYDSASLGHGGRIFS